MEEEKSFIDQVREEKTALERIRDEHQRILEQMKALKANEIMSGKSSAGTPPEPKKEIDPVEYAKAALEGKLLE